MSETVRVYHGSKRGLEGAIRADRGYPTNDFGAGLMASEEVEGLDADYDRMQWAGEAYVLECVVRESGLKPDATSRRVYDREAIFWAGFICRRQLQNPASADARGRASLPYRGKSVGSRVPRDRNAGVLQLPHRFWNFKTGETSRAIHAQFHLAEVLSVYPGFHTLDNNRAVDEMVELARKRAA